MYFSILRTNRNFRLLYIGQAISQLGDWFNAVAVYALLLDLTGSATAVAWMMIVQFLPIALVGPLAGVVVDRVNRRRLMIAADVVRGCLILGLLLVKSADHIWIAYLVMALTVSASAFFEPARTATIPNITSAEELLPANALSSATWSAMLAVGASIGGLMTVALGRDIAFAINAASFFASALFIGRTRYDANPAAGRPPLRGLAAITGVSDLVEGIRYVRQRSHVGALIFVKAGWGLAGGVLLLLTIFGQRVFPVAGSTAAGIGVLYGARGLGAGLGPIALRWILGQKPQTLRRTIGRGLLRRAGGGADAADCSALRHARAFRRIDSVGIQHRAPADGSAGSVPRSCVRDRARAGHAHLIDFELLDRLRAGPRRLVAPDAVIRAGRDVLRPRRVVAAHSVALARGGARAADAIRRRRVGRGRGAGRTNWVTGAVHRARSSSIAL